MDTLSLTKEARIYNGEKTTSLTSGAGKTGQPLVKESNTVHKNKPKMDQRYNVRPKTIRLLEENTGKTLSDKSEQDPLWSTSQNTGNKSKNKQMGPNET